MLPTLLKKELYFRGQSKLSLWTLSFRQWACVITSSWCKKTTFSVQWRGLTNCNISLQSGPECLSLTEKMLYKEEMFFHSFHYIYVSMYTFMSVYIGFINFYWADPPIRPSSRTSYNHLGLYWNQWNIA